MYWKDACKFWEFLITWWEKPPGTGQALSWSSDVFVMFVASCSLSWRLNLLSKLHWHVVWRREKNNSRAPPFCLRGMCCSASASLDGDIGSGWVRKLTKKPDTVVALFPPKTCSWLLENRLCRRDPVFFGGLGCLPEPLAGSYMWSELFFSFVFASWNFLWVTEDAIEWHHIFCPVTWMYLTSVNKSECCVLCTAAGPSVSFLGPCRRWAGRGMDALVWFLLCPCGHK